MKLKALLDIPLPWETHSGETPDREIDRVCDDSRHVSSGAMFIAVEGAVSDGHDYLLSAYDLGCRAFVVQKYAGELPEDAFVAVFEDSRKALALLSAKILGEPAKKLKLIGLTGTKGKTTTALMLQRILCECGIKTGYIGSNGVKYGTVSLPDTKNTTPGSLELNRYLADMVRDGVTHAVLEVSSQALYMNRVFGIDFDTVIFTNIGRDDHIGGAEHPTFEHYVECKRTLFFDHGAKNMVCNADDPFCNSMIPPHVKPIRVSLKGNGDYNARNINFFNSDGVLGVTAVCSTPSMNINVMLPIPGYFNVMNSMCAIAAASCYGIKPLRAFRILKKTFIEGRFECVPVAKDRIFVIDFAHNGMALRSVLNALKEYSPKRLICVFGSVGGRTYGRRKALGDVAAEMCDIAIITADDPNFEPPSSIAKDILPSFENSKCVAIEIDDREQAIKYALAQSREGDIVLFAGKGHENFQLIKGIRERFSERELINKYKEVIPAVIPSAVKE